MLNKRSLADAFKTRCCGPEGCGTTAPMAGMPNGPGRYCIGPACMAWRWDGLDDQDDQVRTQTWFTLPENPAYAEALAAEAAIPWLEEPNEEARAATKAVERLQEEMEAGLEAWAPAEPEGERWMLAEKTLVLGDEDRTPSYRAKWVRLKKPGERFGRCGYIPRE